MKLWIDEGRTLVTNNFGDFRQLCERQAVHPGLIVLPTLMEWVLVADLMIRCPFNADQGEGREARAAGGAGAARRVAAAE